MMKPATSVPTLAAVYLSLLLLLVLTTGLAYLDLGPWNSIIAVRTMPGLNILICPTALSG